MATYGVTPWAQQVTSMPANVNVLSGTSAVTIGAGGAGDTMLMGIVILKNAGPATATITGFVDQDGSTARSVVLTGSTAADTVYSFGAGLINSEAALTITPSVTLTVVVYWRAA